MPEGRRAGELGEKGEGIKNYKLAATKQSWACKVGNIVNNITITMYCARWVLKILGGLFGSLRSAMTFGKNKHL